MDSTKTQQTQPAVTSFDGQHCENGTCLIAPIFKESNITIKLNLDTRSLFEASKEPPKDLKLQLSLQPTCKGQKHQPIQRSNQIKIEYKTNAELLTLTEVRDVEKSTANGFFKLIGSKRYERLGPSKIV